MFRHKVRDFKGPDFARIEGLKHANPRLRFLHSPCASKLLVFFVIVQTFLDHSQTCDMYFATSSLG